MPGPAAALASDLGRPASATRERILDGAEALFAERGLAGTSVRDLAARVGITPAGLYNHFAGKQALYEAVLERGIRPLLDLMQELADRERPADAGEAIVGAVMRHLAERPHLPRLIYHEATSGGEHLGALARAWIRPLVERGVAAMQREPAGVFEPDEFPLVVAAWLSLVFGHFALAPLLGELPSAAPLSPEGLARQTRFLHKLARLMSGAHARLEDGEAARLLNGEAAVCGPPAHDPLEDPS